MGRSNIITIPRGRMDSRVSLMAQASALSVPNVRTSRRVNVTLEPEKAQPAPREEEPVNRYRTNYIVDLIKENTHLRSRVAILENQLKALEIRTGVKRAEDIA